MHPWEAEMELILNLIFSKPGWLRWYCIWKPHNEDNIRLFKLTLCLLCQLVLFGLESFISVLFQFSIFLLLTLISHLSLGFNLYATLVSNQFAWECESLSSASTSKLISLPFGTFGIFTPIDFYTAFEFLKLLRILIQ